MSKDLSLEEKATNYDTMLHIREVGKAVNKVVSLTLERVTKHDQSKLESPEVEIFTEYTEKLAGMTYGSKEYNECRASMGEALSHHYAVNNHHPEHYKNGIDDMNLLDLMEMFCDWRAASMRHNDGNLRKSIAVNGDRFGMSPQLVKIFENTIGVLED